MRDGIAGTAAVVALCSMICNARAAEELHFCQTIVAASTRRLPDVQNPCSGSGRVWGDGDGQVLLPVRSEAELRSAAAGGAGTAVGQRTDPKAVWSYPLSQSSPCTDYQLDFDADRREVTGVGYCQWWPESVRMMALHASPTGESLAFFPTRIGSRRNPMGCYLDPDDV